MSFPTTPAFITATKGWEQACAHPCMQWMESYTNAFDNKQVLNAPLTDWQTADFVYQKATGEIFPPGETSFDAVKETYAPFASHLHEPSWLCCWETKDGWEMVGTAWMFADLPVSGGAKQQTDATGKSWDLKLPGMFHFEYVKDSGAKHGGIAIKSTKVYSDSGPAVVEMLKRGMVKPEQLLG